MREEAEFEVVSGCAKGLVSKTEALYDVDVDLCEIFYQ
jgi:hypothetical protein